MLPLKKYERNRKLEDIQSTEETSPSIIDNTASDSHDDVALILTDMRNSNDSNTPRTDDNVDEFIEAATDNSTNEQDTTDDENRPKGGRPNKSNNTKKNTWKLLLLIF